MRTAVQEEMNRQEVCFAGDVGRGLAIGGLHPSMADEESRDYVIQGVLRSQTRSPSERGALAAALLRGWVTCRG